MLRHYISFCPLCFLTESCKDILAATGNYAQPEVTTLTWCWLAMKRRKSVISSVAYTSPPEWTAEDILRIQDENFCFKLHSTFITCTLTYMLESILHVLHAQALYDTPFICILFSGYVIAGLQGSEKSIADLFQSDVKVTSLPDLKSSKCDITFFRAPVESGVRSL